MTRSLREFVAWSVYMDEFMSMEAEILFAERLDFGYRVLPFRIERSNFRASPL